MLIESSELISGCSSELIQKSAWTPSELIPELMLELLTNSSRTHSEPIAELIPLGIKVYGLGFRV